MHDSSPTSVTATAAGAVELAAGSLYGLGGELEVRDTASWIEPGERGRQRFNAYLLIDADDALLIDSGPAALRAPIIDQLIDLLPANAEVSFVLTRSEFETTGNISAIAEAAPVKAVYAAGQNNPFDGFQLAAAPAANKRRPGGVSLQDIELTRVKAGESITFGEAGRLEVLTAPVRMLACSWYYDAGTRTLFPSDFFGYAVDTPEISVEQAYRSLRARYWWLPGARTKHLIEDLDAVFAARDVEVIAPSHGLVFHGDEVERQLQTMRDVLRLAATDSLR